MEFALLTLLGVGALVALFDAFDDDDNQVRDIDGTEEDDTLTGGDGRETISGLAGDDILIGDGGDDFLRGGDGDDLLRGGDGDDIIITDESMSVSDGGGLDVGMGDAGDDTLRGGIETDILSGGDGDDLVVGDFGDDWLQGDAGDDTLEGRLGLDTLIGGDGSDTLEGGNGRDVLFGGNALTTPLTTEADFLDVREDFADGANVSFPGDAPITATDDGDPDILDGGNSSDTLFLGLGDTGTGGDGADLFHLIGAVDDELIDPSIITDFESSVDQLLIEDFGDPDPEFVLMPGEDGLTSVIYGDVTLATVRGTITLDDIIYVTA